MSSKYRDYPKFYAGREHTHSCNAQDARRASTVPAENRTESRVTSRNESVEGGMSSRTITPLFTAQTPTIRRRMARVPRCSVPRRSAATCSAVPAGPDPSRAAGVRPCHPNQSGRPFRAIGALRSSVRLREPTPSGLLSTLPENQGESLALQRGDESDNRLTTPRLAPRSDVLTNYLA